MLLFGCLLGFVCCFGLCFSCLLFDFVVRLVWFCLIVWDDSDLWVWLVFAFLCWLIVLLVRVVFVSILLFVQVAGVDVIWIVVVSFVWWCVLKLFVYFRMRGFWLFGWLCCCFVCVAVDFPCIGLIEPYALCAGDECWVFVCFSLLLCVTCCCLFGFCGLVYCFCLFLLLGRIFLVTFSFGLNWLIVIVCALLVAIGLSLWFICLC